LLRRRHERLHASRAQHVRRKLTYLAQRSARRELTMWTEHTCISIRRMNVSATQPAFFIPHRLENPSALLSLAPVSGLSQALTCLYTLQINPEIPALYWYVCRTRSRYLHELVEQGSEA
jgi:hypothetical protein